MECVGGCCECIFNQNKSLVRCEIKKFAALPYLHRSTVVEREMMPIIFAKTTKFKKKKKYLSNR